MPAPPRRDTQTVRIIGGQWRSRLIRFPAVPGLRPTGDRLRETLFNWLGQDLEGKAVLDLFAGSGALGFEAASRNARRVTMLERDARASAALHTNQAALQAAQVEILTIDALDFLRRAQPVYDVVFVDPPFDAKLHDRVLAALPAALAPGCMIYVESPLDWAFPDYWLVHKQGKMGNIMARLLNPPGLK
jgi:16S rRNA (guanine966-N2)-methyltransferase